MYAHIFYVIFFCGEMDGEGILLFLDMPIARCEANTMVVVRKRLLHVQLLWAYARSTCAARGIYSYTFIGRLGCLIWHHYSCATKGHRLVAQCRCQHQWAGITSKHCKLGRRILMNHGCYILKFWLVEITCHEVLPLQKRGSNKQSMAAIVA